ncbi:unnamed protein product [Gongylonema pulchrum]|uniref:TIP41-like protein n=1 Tax=Gongylonema pulchrum TaxID=637853 RepID=A0A183DQI7_9BILA|nr:unnamed protein product [Gongylonema pulchrum]
MHCNNLQDEFSFGDVSILVTHDHILSSQCRHPETATGSHEYCQVCEYGRSLELPQLPEMVFPNNSVIIACQDQPQLRIGFNALDALKLVNVVSFPDLEVGPSKKWRESRNMSQLERSGRPFDWTYTSNYKGTVSGFKVVPTSDRISVEKLKRRDPINFYSELIFVRLRVMPTCLFLLCRFYLRVDDVLVRICDTRLYKEIESNSTLLRQWTRREMKLADSPHVVRSNAYSPSAVYDHLPTVEEEITKLVRPELITLDS